MTAPILTRFASIDLSQRKSSPDGLTRYPAVLSTETPVRRRSYSGSYDEVLSHKASAVDLSRSPLPLLESHDRSKVNIGKVENMRIDGDKLRGDLVLGASQRARELAADIDAGIVSGISIGYSIDTVEIAKPKDSQPERQTATKWTPYEVSIVGIPADINAGIGRGANVEGEVTSEEMLRAERERSEVTRKLCARAGISDAIATRMIDEKKTIDQVREMVLDHLATESDRTAPEPGSGVRFEVGTTEKEKLVRGMIGAELFRKGFGSLIVATAAAVKSEKITTPGVVDAFRDHDPGIDGGGYFRGLSLPEMARELLEHSGHSTRRMSKRQIVEKALLSRSGGEQTISDFAVVLENVMHKVLLGRYAQTPDTWREVCGVDSVQDFRPANRYRMGAFGTLDLKPEGAEYKLKVIPDGAKFQISTQTYGNKIHISREAIVNDDMGAILDQMGQFGRAAGLTLESEFYSLLTSAGGLGPNVTFNGNTAPLFDASWGNVGTGAALSMASVEADRVKLASQKDINGQEYLDLRPNVLLVPIGLEGTANQINSARYDPTAGSAFEAPNYALGLYKKVVGTPRLTGNRRYTFCDPSIVAAFKCVFLDGEQTPMMAEKINWNIDGQEVKLRLDAKMQAHDPKGAITNAGQ